MVWHSITDDPITFVKQYKSFGMKAQLVTDIIHESIAVATRGASTGIIGVTSYMMSLANAENKRFLDSYTARYPNSTPLRVGGNVVMMPMGESAYTGARLYAQAVKAANSTDVAMIKRAMQGLTVDAPRGKVRVGPGATHLLSPTFVAQVGQDNTFQLLSAFDPIAASCTTS
jgi:ABC-type branched-subunit amino acid transport system substrate-binding protein